MSQAASAQAKEREAKEVIALQARLLLFQEGTPGVLVIRRTNEGHRIEVDFASSGSQQAYSARGGLELMARTLAQVGMEFHQVDANHWRKALAAG